MRIMIKGGVWKNTEDEILKAAVMKYGKHQWARVSSFLVRKSAKQCKARWHEWLDPSIKKTDWTREEDEKLLHLAKLMPTQWRTIAPIVGRTSTQCLERYEQLLDQAANGGASGSGGSGGGAPGARKNRPGEVDPNLESRPARPDPVDMDEDEKEMLNEARARLANTKGKKAKRKAREKQLEEARRLATLQKRRELKAAGIDSGKWKKKLLKKGEIDYNAEIAFEHKPPPGFYDTSEERGRERKAMKEQKFKPVSVEELEGKKRKDVEAALIKQDRAKQQMLERKNMPLAVQQQMQGTSGPSVRRGKMVLPAPQLSDAELTEISRMNEKEEALDASVEEGAGGRATKMLLADYAATPNPMATPVRTPRAVTSSGANVILQEAQQLAKMQQQQSTLMGGEGTSIDRSAFRSSLPEPKAMATPNPLATPLHSQGHPSMGSTPMVMGTPLRDGLRINKAAPEMMDFETELEARRALDLQRQSVKLGLSSLPQPKNEYQVVIPDVPTFSDDEGDEDDGMIEDMADVIAKKKAKEEEHRQRELRLRSQVIQRNLPRPTASDVRKSLGDLASASDVEQRRAEALVADELQLLIDRDNKMYPVSTKSRKAKGALPPDLEAFEESELLQARGMIEEENQKLISERHGGGEDLAESHARAMEILHAREEEANMSDVAYLKLNFSSLKSELEKQSHVASKLEKKIGILHGGLEAKHKELLARLGKARQRHQQVQHQLHSYRALSENEKVAAPQRLAKLKMELDAEKEKERVLQRTYAKLHYARAT
ncbi:cell division cycle 5-like protein [Chloropicon primus]|uniref:Cell division cycle 5-like protein n=4 Tax=Chloropicon primus TaxID=1764295 RepID=A0A5B8MLS4_9CHLO|nr:cell division cycle 5-like protein [Chloropicon primus]UPR00604.1 cell division cycle 5-like protein [Chloropicon primus]|eukprot:QDZ21389.1 cell division cycle 5-like protein [Chloropicon primus]